MPVHVTPNKEQNENRLSTQTTFRNNLQIKSFKQPSTQLFVDMKLKASSFANDNLKYSNNRRQFNTDEEARERARTAIKEAQNILELIQTEIKVLNCDKENNLAALKILCTSAGMIASEIAEITKLLDEGGKEEALASIGAVLLAGVLIPAPEEVVTWPVAGIATLGVLIFVASSASAVDINAAVTSLYEVLARAIRRSIRRCRCTLRYAPSDLTISCPDRVYGYGITIGDCQGTAKKTAPEECRRYYGHCGFTQ